MAAKDPVVRGVAMELARWERWARSANDPAARARAAVRARAARTALVAAQLRAARDQVERLTAELTALGGAA